eukprot:TRINITY_DN10860_c0_g1_i1.p2 TRINITY_DN10860_c0_g1~~TRINITY_DN10860_c0_g1_i1.p2  ORF type:complete len:242 (-),score=106.44 TRINITY_DN10860_c0_g1_i1:118-819(-)
MNVSVSNPVAAASASHNPKTSAFQPYVDNGGTALTVVGQNFSVVAADTRMSHGYSIHTRNYTKICQLTNKCVLATSGMQSDTQALQKYLKLRIAQYESDHGKSPSTPALAQMLSNTLYQRRFFPYYTFNILSGVDDNGVGCAFSYDAVGSFEKVQMSATGSGTQLAQPLFDNQIGWKFSKDQKRFESPEEVIELVKDSLSSCGERDIHTGDFADIVVINKDGVQWTKFELKFD